MNRKDRRSPWLLSCNERFLRNGKTKKTEAQILEAKRQGNWSEAIKLKHLLRKVWWGYKKIINKRND